MNTNIKEILVIGLGLIGSSIAKVSKEKGIRVHGFDIDDKSLQYALDNKIIDNSFNSLVTVNNKEITSYVDLIVIAVSPEATKDIINNIQQLWNTQTTITDTSLSLIHI